MTATDTEDVPLSAFVFGFDPDYVKGLVARALQHRAEASESARGALNSAIRDSIRLDGFRDPSRAEPAMLTDEVLVDLCGGNDRLAGAVLKTWAESHRELHDLVVDHLDSVGIPTDYPDFRRRVFVSTWDAEDWDSQREAVAEGSNALDEDDVGLMLCYVSGRAGLSPVEDEEVESPILSDFIDRLGELPADAPEWDEIEAFIETVQEISGFKSGQRRRALVAALEELIATIRRDYDSELRYLEISVGAWEEEMAQRPQLFSLAHDLAVGLRESLREYRPLRPQADSRNEEAARAPARAACEAQILEVVDAWHELMGAPYAPDDEDPPSLDAERPSDESDGPADVPGEASSQSDEEASPEPEGSPGVDEAEGPMSAEEFDVLQSELQRLRREGEWSASERSRLEQANEGLESDRRALDSENRKIREELSQSRNMEEYWRREYVSAKTTDGGPAGEAAAAPGTVSEAIARAQKLFSDQLAFALNSKSAKNSPFQKPDEVFDALAWLATVYQPRRMKPGKTPHFDLKESCSGWSYKPKQTEVTKEKFDEWYTTTVDGKTYNLDAHLGKGNSFDPQNTIRIAFDWDDESSRVIVGYVGLHQRTRSS